MFLCSLIEELCTKEENDKTGCNFNFGHECIYVIREKVITILKISVEKYKGKVTIGIYVTGDRETAHNFTIKHY